MPSPPSPSRSTGNRRPQRRHGLEFPLDLLQTIAIAVYIIFILGYVVIYVPMLPTAAARAGVSVSLGVLGVASMILYYFAASMVADDPLIHDHAEGERRAEELRYCTLCDCHVDSTTKHCMRCNKCVIGFDHHCRWLNNCVGSRNYTVFALFLGTTWTVIALLFGVGVYMIVRFAGYRDDYNSLLGEMFSVGESDGASQSGYFAAIVILCALSFLVLALLSQLAYIHILLAFQGITTYQRILNLRHEAVEEQRERDALAMEAKWWHGSCHNLAVWCHTKGCERPVAASTDAASPSIVVRNGSVCGAVFGRRRRPADEEGGSDNGGGGAASQTQATAAGSGDNSATNSKKGKASAEGVLSATGSGVGGFSTAGPSEEKSAPPALGNEQEMVVFSSSGGGGTTTPIDVPSSAAGAAYAAGGSGRSGPSSAAAAPTANNNNNNNINATTGSYINIATQQKGQSPSPATAAYFNEGNDEGNGGGGYSPRGEDGGSPVMREPEDWVMESAARGRRSVSAVANNSDNDGTFSIAVTATTPNAANNNNNRGGGVAGGSNVRTVSSTIDRGVFSPPPPFGGEQHPSSAAAASSPIRVQTTDPHGLPEDAQSPSRPLRLSDEPPSPPRNKEKEKVDKKEKREKKEKKDKAAAKESASASAVAVVSIPAPMPATTLMSEQPRRPAGPLPPLVVGGGAPRPLQPIATATSTFDRTTAGVVPNADADHPAFNAGAQ